MRWLGTWQRPCEGATSTAAVAGHPSRRRGQRWVFWLGICGFFLGWAVSASAQVADAASPPTTLGWSSGWQGSLFGSSGPFESKPSLAQCAYWWQQKLGQPPSPKAGAGSEPKGFPGNRSHAGSGPIWIDAGDFLVGPDAMGSQGRAVVQGLSAAGLHGAHMTPRDLWFGLDGTRALLEDAKFVPFSANLREVNSRQRLWAPYIEVLAQGTPVRITGLSAPGDATPPGVWVGPLQENWAKVRREIDGLGTSGALWVCFFGSLEDSQDFASLDVSGCAGVLWVGGAQPPTAWLEREPGRHRILSKDRARLPWIWATGDGFGEAYPLDLAHPSAGVLGASEPAVEQAIQEQPSVEDLWNTPVETPGPATPWPKQAGNRALQVSIVGARWVDRWQGHAAPAGHGWWVCELDWENRMARDLRTDLDFPEAVQITSPSKQVFLHLPGAGWRRATPRGPGPMHLPALKDWQTQEVAFPVQTGRSPEGTPGAQLIVIHEPFATIALPLASPQVTAPVPAPNLAPPSSQHAIPGPGLDTKNRPDGDRGGGRPLAANGVLEVLDWQCSRLAGELPGKGAGPAVTRWRVRVAARSLVQLPVHARALEPKAAVKDMAMLGKPLEYLLAPEMVALVDGSGMRFAPAIDSPCDPEPVWSAEASHWVTWYFDLPDIRLPAGLSLDFPGLRFTHETDLRQPDRLWLPRPPSELPSADPEPGDSSEPLVQWPGSPIEATVWGGVWEAGYWRVSIELVLRGSEPGFCLPWRRLRWQPTTGDEVEPSAGESWGVPASGRLWLGSGIPVRIECAFPCPDPTQPGTLHWAGVDRPRAASVAPRNGRLVLSGPSSEPSPMAQPEGSEPADMRSKGAQEPGERPIAKGLAGVGLTAEVVNAAIDRGADFLWAHARDEMLGGDLSKFGTGHQKHPLLALALVHAGLHERNEEFARALREAIPRMESVLTQVYPNSVLCMLLDDLADPAYRPLLTRAARHLIEGQGSDGTWGYHVPRWGAGAEQGGAAHYVTVFGPAEASLERQTPWPKEAREGDNSVLQFALMGLRSAQRRGVKIPQETWRRAEQAVLPRQQPDGAWGYVDGRGYGSMTCAGMASLAITRWGQGKPFGLQQARIRAGYDWLVEHYQVSSNPKHSRHNYYYMYSIERVGRLFDTEFYGDREWYPLGARHLVQTQEAHGAWKEGKDVVVPTSFALLFLTRATESLMETAEKPATGRLRVEAAPVPESGVLFVLDVSGSMRGSMGERSKWDWARQSLLEVVEALPDDQQVGLRVYGHRRRAIHAEADRDTALLLPIERKAAQGQAAWEGALAGLKPRGKTPMAYSLEQSLRDLSSVPRGHIVLLTDGGEDTRERRDPVAAAQRVGTRRGWSLQVVGFDIGKPKWRQQLEAMARAGGGAYLPVDRGDVLRACLQGAIRPLPDRMIVAGPGGEREVPLPGELDLEPGEYRLRFEVAGQPFEVYASVRAGALTRVRLDPEHFGERSGQGTEPAPR